MMEECYGGEKTNIKQAMHSLCNRRFVSVYIGRMCIGVVMMEECHGGEWYIANAVVDSRARSKGLGKYMALAAMRLAFQHTKKLSLGAELEEITDPETGEKDFVPREKSGAYRFWKRLQFRNVNQKEYDR